MPTMSLYPPPSLGYPLLFFVCTLGFGAYFLNVTPPYQGADERNHLSRAYAISTGEYFPDTASTDRRGGYVPRSLLVMKDTFWHLRFHADRKTTYAAVAAFGNVPLRPGELKFQDYPNTAVYPWPVYAPAAIGLKLATILDLSALGTLRAARWLGLLYWLATGTMALWLLPAWRGLFTALFLLPMTTWTHACVSADTFTNGVAFLTVASLLNLAYRPRERLAARHWLLLFAVAALLPTAKLVYSPLLLLAVLIPARRFGGIHRKLFAGVAVVTIALLTLLYWAGHSDAIYLPYPEYAEGFRDGDIGLTRQAHVREHRAMVIKAPYRLFRAAWNGLIEIFPFYSRGYVGILGWIDTYLKTWLYWIAYVYLFALAFTERGVKVWHRGVFLLTVIATYLLVILSQLLSWEKVGTHIVNAIMGRYLIPFVPVFFLLFGGLPLKIPSRIYVIAAGSSALLVATAIKVYSRYYG